jgi:hypothetical protein
MPVQSHLIAYSAELVLNTFQEVGTKSKRKKNTTREETRFSLLFLPIIGWILCPGE